MTNPDLARVLRELGDKGAKDGFYRGATGQAIVDIVQHHGGCLTLDDLPRHAREMLLTDDRLRFGDAIRTGTNAEAAMQSWRKDPFPERKYERLLADTVCAGLSTVDEKIALNVER